MEYTKCIFNRTQPGCKGKIRHNVDMLMCEKHLYQVYGLDKMRVNHETETGYQVVGGFLKPAEGHIIHRNDVIIPMRQFFDQFFQPENLSALPDQMSYQMNSFILEWMRQSQVTKLEQPIDKRFLFEIARNLSDYHNDANYGPRAGQENTPKNPLADIQLKFQASENMIKMNSVHSYMFENSILYQKELMTFKDICAKGKMSNCLVYLLNHCMFQGHTLMSPKGSEIVTDYMMYNCVFEPDVGLVATEDISNPMPLVIAGVSKGNVPFYNSIVVPVRKDIKPRKILDRDLMSQFGLNDSFRGGSQGCLY